MQGLGFDPDTLHVVLVQMVQLTRGGEPVRMGKRTGDFVALEDVIEEVGRDAARFFLLMRKSDAISISILSLPSASRAKTRSSTCSTRTPASRAFSSRRPRAASVWERSDAVPIERLELAEELELIRQMIQFNDVSKTVCASSNLIAWSFICWTWLVNSIDITTVTG